MTTLSRKQKRQLKKSQDTTKRSPTKPLAAPSNRLQALFVPPNVGHLQENAAATQELLATRGGRSDTTTSECSTASFSAHTDGSLVDKHSCPYEGPPTFYNDRASHQVVSEYLDDAELRTPDILPPSISESSFVTAQESTGTSLGLSTSPVSIPSHIPMASTIPTARPSPSFGFMLQESPRYSPREASPEVCEAPLGNYFDDFHATGPSVDNRSDPSMIFPMSPPGENHSMTIRHRSVNFSHDTLPRLSLGTTWVPSSKGPVPADILFRATPAGPFYYPDHLPTFDGAFPYLRDIQQYDVLDVIHINPERSWLWLAKHPYEGHLGWISDGHFVRFQVPPVSQSRLGIPPGFERVHSQEGARHQLGPNCGQSPHQQDVAPWSPLSLGASSSVDLSNLPGALRGSVLYRPGTCHDASHAPSVISDPCSSPDIGRPTMPANLAEHHREQDAKLAERQATWRAREFQVLMEEASLQHLLPPHEFAATPKVSTKESHDSTLENLLGLFGASTRRLVYTELWFAAAAQRQVFDSTPGNESRMYECQMALQKQQNETERLKARLRQCLPRSAEQTRCEGSSKKGLKKVTWEELRRLISGRDDSVELSRKEKDLVWEAVKKGVIVISSATTLPVSKNHMGDGVTVAGPQWERLLGAVDEVKNEARRELELKLQAELDKREPHLKKRIIREVVEDMTTKASRRDWDALILGTSK